jgi:hypothetical protein
MRHLIFLITLLFSLQSFSAQWAENLNVKDGKVTFKNIGTATATPQSGYSSVGVSTDKQLYFVDDTGLVKNVLLGGTAYLDDLLDVVVATATTGQALVFDGTNWVNANVSQSLSTLTDVDVSTATTNEFLKYDGTKWVNSNVPQINTLDDIGDVEVATATAGKVLGYDGSKWVPTNGGSALGALGAVSPIVLTQDSDSATISLGTADYIDFNTATVPAHSDGRIHYDSTDKTLSIDIDSANGVELQVGQEEYIRVVNKTGIQINDGQVVYVNGAQGNRPTIDLAIGSGSLANKTIGVATQNISDNAEGMITTDGVVGGYDTSGFTAGDRLYLSTSVSGSLTNVKPSAPNYAVPVAWALNSANDGKILIDVRSSFKVDDLANVTLSSIANGDRLVYSNGSWVNSPNSNATVGSAVNFYLDESTSFADNFSLQISPSSYAESIDTRAVTSALSPVFIERYVSGALSRTSIPAGTWTFKIYGRTSNATGNNQIALRVNKRVGITGCTGTFTGAGATRTFTTTGCAPFVAGDANANRLLANLIETPTQTAWINGYISSSQVTVTLSDAAFVNVAGTPFSAMYYYLFNTTTGDINTTTGAELQTITTTQPAFTASPTDRLVLALFAKTDQVSSRNISLYHGGTANYTYFTTPLSTQHNDLAGIQGGALDDYYHLTQLKYNAVQNLTASGTQTNFTGDVQSASCVYHGDSVTDGSHRSCQVGGALIYQKRVSGSWLETYRVE